jgi:hypothetical protein
VYGWQVLRIKKTTSSLNFTYKIASQNHRSTRTKNNCVFGWKIATMPGIPFLFLEKLMKLF